ncbi:DUF805 domain-containing protein [Pseudoclavibacter terrae]|uniref:DUF805 domain-containing protein n=1 Tax=Pseudoclavibacter terrae TaxID=1530195 RepID=UPI00232CD4E7|nr:DUF805 domain-containing protein [Pseudoclavibacter terrae]
MTYGQAPAGRPTLEQPYYGAPFPEAIVRFVKKTFVYRGRASRSEYWWVALALAGLTIVFNVIAMGLDFRSGSTPTWVAIGGGLFGLFSLLVNLALLLPTISMQVRRLHDANFSGFFAFLGLVPLFGPIALVVFACLPSVPAGARFDGTGQHPASNQGYYQGQPYQAPVQGYGQPPTQPQAPGQYYAPNQDPSAPQSDPYSAPDAWNGPSSTDPGQTR